MLPPKGPGNDRRAHFAFRRRDAEAAEERRQRHFPRMPAVAGCRARDVALRIDIVAPGRLGQIRAEHRGVIVADHGAEARD